LYSDADENSNMTHLKNAPMTGTNADWSHQPGSQGCPAEVVVDVALDGDVVLLAKGAAIKSVAQKNGICRGAANLWCRGLTSLKPKKPGNARTRRFWRAGKD
jgi:hypothetical protein